MLENLKLVLILNLLLLALLFSGKRLLFRLVNFVLKVADLVQLLTTSQLARLALALCQLKVVLGNLERGFRLAELLALSLELY